MKRRTIALFMTVIILLGSGIFIGQGTPAYAVTNSQETAVESLLDEAQRVSRAPGISVMVFSENEARFFSSGTANLETGKTADEDTLWELASVSKAFTALGILYLEERGLLSLSDPVAKYLPWLSLRFRGQPVDMQDLKLYHLMHHTSGFTSRNTHMTRGERDTLENAVLDLKGSGLSFYPGERHGYGNENYIILGLIIEIVTGQSYETFMREQIFQPLGLHSTFAGRGAAYETGRLAQGYKREFVFFRREASFPGPVGNAPTGLLITSAGDMARWMGIHLGAVDDIPEIFKTIVPRTHGPGRSVAEEDGSYYAAGWRVNPDGTIIEHGGDSPGFSTYALMFPGEKVAIAVFSNMGHSNMRDAAYSIKDILEGDLQPPFGLRPGGMQILDIIFSAGTVIGLVLAFVFLVLGLHRKKQSETKVPITRKKVVTTILGEVVVSVAIILVLPLIIPGSGGSWQSILSLVSYSFLTCPIAFMLMSLSMAWLKLISISAAR